MRAATKFLLLAIAPVALAGCKKSQQTQDQNMAISGPATNEAMANADVEMLPPDESSADSSNELVTGTDNPDVNDLNVSANSE
jgi:uncharacterized lipoprotein YajG